MIIFLDDYCGHWTKGKRFKEGKVGELGKADEADLVRRGIAEYVGKVPEPASSVGLPVEDTLQEYFESQPEFKAKAKAKAKR